MCHMKFSCSTYVELYIYISDYILNRIDTYRNDAQWEYNNGSYSYVCIVRRYMAPTKKKKKRKGI